MRNEALVSYGYELTDEGVRLNPASLPDCYSFLYLYEWADEAVISDCASIEIDRLHHRDGFHQTLHQQFLHAGFLALSQRSRLVAELKEPG